MRTLILSLAFVLLVGCNTSPQSMINASLLATQMQKAQQQDAIDIAYSSNEEIKHWVDISFDMKMEEAEGKLVDSNGMVNLEQYKAVREEIETARSTIKNEYDSDYSDIVEIMNDKAEKQLLLLYLIHEFETSTGTSPETVMDLMDTLGDVTQGAMNVYQAKKAKEAAEPPSWGDQFKIKLQGMGDDLFIQLQNQYQKDWYPEPVTEGE